MLRRAATRIDRVAKHCRRDATYGERQRRAGLLQRAVGHANELTPFSEKHEQAHSRVQLVGRARAVDGLLPRAPERALGDRSRAIPRRHWFARRNELSSAPKLGDVYLIGIHPCAKAFAGRVASNARRIAARVAMPGRPCLVGMGPGGVLMMSLSCFTTVVAWPALSNRRIRASTRHTWNRRGTTTFKMR